MIKIFVYVLCYINIENFIVKICFVVFIRKKNFLKIIKVEKVVLNVELKIMKFIY